MNDRAKFTDLKMRDRTNKYKLCNEGSGTKAKK